jgi:hypothetical protein
VIPSVDERARRGCPQEVLRHAIASHLVLHRVTRPQFAIVNVPAGRVEFDACDSVAKHTVGVNQYWRECGCVSTGGVRFA